MSIYTSQYSRRDSENFYANNAKGYGSKRYYHQNNTPAYLEFIGNSSPHVDRTKIALLAPVSVFKEPPQTPTRSNHVTTTVQKYSSSVVQKSMSPIKQSNASPVEPKYTSPVEQENTSPITQRSMTLDALRRSKNYSKLWTEADPSCSVEYLVARDKALDEMEGRPYGTSFSTQARAAELNAARARRVEQFLKEQLEEDPLFGIASSPEELGSVESRYPSPVGEGDAAPNTTTHRLQSDIPLDNKHPTADKSRAFAPEIQLPRIVRPNSFPSVSVNVSSVSQAATCEPKLKPQDLSSTRIRQLLRETSGRSSSCSNESSTQSWMSQPITPNPSAPKTSNHHDETMSRPEQRRRGQGNRKHISYPLVPTLPELLMRPHPREAEASYGGTPGQNYTSGTYGGFGPQVSWAPVTNQNVDQVRTQDVRRIQVDDSWDSLALRAPERQGNFSWDRSDSWTNLAGPSRPHENIPLQGAQFNQFRPQGSFYPVQTISSNQVPQSTPQPAGQPVQQPKPQAGHHPEQRPQARQSVNLWAGPDPFEFPPLGSSRESVTRNLRQQRTAGDQNQPNIQQPELPPTQHSPESHPLSSPQATAGRETSDKNQHHSVGVTVPPPTEKPVQTSIEHLSLEKTHPPSVVTPHHSAEHPNPDKVQEHTTVKSLSRSKNSDSKAVKTIADIGLLAPTTHLLESCARLLEFSGMTNEPPTEPPFTSGYLTSSQHPVQIPTGYYGQLRIPPPAVKGTRADQARDQHFQQTQASVRPTYAPDMPSHSLQMAHHPHVTTKAHFPDMTYRTFGPPTPAVLPGNGSQRNGRPSFYARTAETEPSLANKKIELTSRSPSQLQLVPSKPMTPSTRPMSTLKPEAEPYVPVGMKLITNYAHNAPVTDESDRRPSSSVEADSKRNPESSNHTSQVAPRSTNPQPTDQELDDWAYEILYDSDMQSQIDQYFLWQESMEEKSGGQGEVGVLSGDTPRLTIVVRNILLKNHGLEPLPPKKEKLKEELVHGSQPEQPGTRTPSQQAPIGAERPEVSVDSDKPPTPPNPPMSAKEAETRAWIDMISAPLANLHESRSGKKRNYFFNYAQPPPWAIDSRPGSNKSFFSGEEWGAPPQRVARDPRYLNQGTIHDGRYTYFENLEGGRARGGGGRRIGGFGGSAGWVR